jgi:hypothetical protein
MARAAVRDRCSLTQTGALDRLVADGVGINILTIGQLEVLRGINN